MVATSSSWKQSFKEANISSYCLNINFHLSSGLANWCVLPGHSPQLPHHILRSFGGSKIPNTVTVNKIIPEHDSTHFTNMIQLNDHVSLGSLYWHMHKQLKFRYHRHRVTTLLHSPGTVGANTWAHAHELRLHSSLQYLAM